MATPRRTIAGKPREVDSRLLGSFVLPDPIVITCLGPRLRGPGTYGTTVNTAGTVAATNPSLKACDLNLPSPQHGEKAPNGALSD